MIICRLSQNYEWTHRYTSQEICRCCACLESDPGKKLIHWKAKAVIFYLANLVLTKFSDLYFCYRISIGKNNQTFGEWGAHNIFAKQKTTNPTSKLQVMAFQWRGQRSGWATHHSVWTHSPKRRRNNRNIPLLTYYKKVNTDILYDFYFALRSKMDFSPITTLRLRWAFCRNT